MSRWSEYKEKNGVTPLDMLSPMTVRAANTTFESRMAICRACPELWKATEQCKQCGCFMNAKARLEAAKCPIGKW